MCINLSKYCFPPTNRNGFYGGYWASLMQKEFQEWIQISKQEDEEKEMKPTTMTMCDNKTITIQQTSCGVSSISEIVHGSEEVDSKVSSECTSQDQPSSRHLSWNSLDSQKRRLVYDLCPKVATVCQLL